MENEVWKPVVGYEGLYQVSNLGRVKETKGEKEIILPQYLRSYDNRFDVHLDRRPQKVHRLVALAFIPIPKKYDGVHVEKLEVHHINLNPKDNRPENLCWLTKTEHINEHKNIMGKTIVQCSLDGVPIKEWDSARGAERGLKKNGVNIHNEHIIECCKGKRKTTAGYIWRYKK